MYVDSNSNTEQLGQWLETAAAVYEGGKRFKEVFVRGGRPLTRRGKAYATLMESRGVGDANKVAREWEKKFDDCRAPAGACWDGLVRAAIVGLPPPPIAPTEWQVFHTALSRGGHAGPDSTAPRRYSPFDPSLHAPPPRASTSARDRGLCVRVEMKRGPFGTPIPVPRPVPCDDAGKPVDISTRRELELQPGPVSKKEAGVGAVGIAALLLLLL